MDTTPEGRLRALRITLPELLPVVGSYRLAKRHEDTVYVAGHAGMLGNVTHLRLVTCVCEEFACRGDDELPVAVSVGP